MGDLRRSCTSRHDSEVLAVFAVDRDADSPYPGTDALEEVGRRRCRPIVDGLEPVVEDLQVAYEIPTEAGWADADHDVACVAIITSDAPLID